MQECAVVIQNKNRDNFFKENLKKEIYLKNLKIKSLFSRGSFLKLRVEKCEKNQRIFLYILSLFLGSYEKIILKNEVLLKIRIRKPSYHW